MDYSEFIFPSCSGLTQIHVNQWLPSDGNVRGVIQIAHGVAEYGKRYEDFARFLCRKGFAVLANDHLGHGQSQIPDCPRVYLGEVNGWWNVVEDMEKLRRLIADRFPQLPIYLFGHSMGSFLTRSHMILYPGKYDGYILCGTGHPGAMTIGCGKILADCKIRKHGKTACSPFMDQLAFGNYNKKFSPNRTSFDWGSLNEENVDAYLADPLCGGKTTLGLFRDMFEGLRYIISEDNIRKMDKHAPVLFISGGDDPVGDMGNGVKKAYERFQAAGLEDVQMKLYPTLRHEILNEESNMQVYRDVGTWLDAHIRSLHGNVEVHKV